MRLGWITALGMSLVAATAEGASVTAVLDRAEASPEDEVLLTVVVEGSQDARPTLPALPDFDVQSRGQSTQVQIINGRMKSSVQYTFALAPKRTGTLTIAPVRVEIDGRTLTSRPLALRVTATPSAPRAEQPVFATATVANTAPYQSQQVVYTLRLYARVEVSCPSVELPSFDGALVEELGQQRRYDTMVDGQRFSVVELRRALFPSAAGKLELGAARFTCDVQQPSARRSADPFEGFGVFGRRAERRNLRTNTLTLDVRPLPAPPVGFTGLVGRFDVGAAISRTQLRLGDSATLTVSVSGSGNVQQIPEPRIEGLARFKVYDDKPITSTDSNGSELVGRRTFQKALVPLDPGTQVIPSVSLVYFDPELERYQTASSAPLTIVVTGGPAQDGGVALQGTPQAPAKRTVEVLGEDILPIYKKLDALGSSTLARSGWGLLGGMALPPVLCLGFVAWRRHRERYLGDGRRLRRTRAMSRARATLDEASRAAPGGAPAALVSRALRELVGDKLDREGAALTEAEATTALRAAGASEALLTDMQRILSECERLQYGGGAAGVERDATLVDEARALVRRVEEELR